MLVIEVGIYSHC